MDRFIPCRVSQNLTAKFDAAFKEREEEEEHKGQGLNFDRNAFNDDLESWAQDSTATSAPGQNPQQQDKDT